MIISKYYTHLKEPQMHLFHLEEITGE